MIPMRSFSISVLALLLAFPLAAQQVHQATPIDQLLREYWAAHPSMHMHESPRLVAGVTTITTDEVNAAATKSFTITAHGSSGNAGTFGFNTSAALVVNMGDTVTLDITSSDGTHGFFLEQYVTGNVEVSKGQHQMKTFVANVPGTFTYFCTISSCGAGHVNMFGTFTVNAPAAAPSITSFTPRTGSPNGGTNVAITGTNFQNGATVKFGDTNAVSVSVNNGTSINATSPVHAAGDVQITVTNPDGQSASSGTFTYLTPAPSVASISPSSGSNAGGTPITISGANFLGTVQVTIGGLAATVTTVTSSAIFAITPAGPFDFATTASRDVTVTNPDGRSATLTNGFTYTLPAPSITGISPNGSGPNGGTQVVITGTGFSSGAAMSVKFGGVAGTGLQVTSPTSLTVTAPAHATGTVDVVLSVGSASTTSAGSFTYQTPSKKRRAVRLQ